MSAGACARKWQVEAAHDGRITGKDRQNALRHAETCVDCMQEGRALVALEQTVAALPLLRRDPLTARRGRQRLLAEMNQRIIPLPSKRIPALLAWALVPLALIAVLAIRAAAPAPAQVITVSHIVRVHARAGARWSSTSASSLETVDLFEGFAAFEVLPHPGRRVLINLPDGQVEDTGTVFEIEVDKGRTRRVAVSRGSVSVRLLGTPALRLIAGQSWQAEATPMTASEPLPPPVKQSPVTSASRPPAFHAQPAQSRALAQPAPAQADANGDATSTDLTRAEDDTYLRIVQLQKEGHYAESRQLAKSYLLRFPNGLRRVEVLNLATQSSPEPPR